MVFQSYAVWPHMTVFDNVAFPLTDGKRRLPRSKVRERVMGALEMVQLSALADRPVPFLSGGQQQRGGAGAGVGRGAQGSPYG